MLLPQGLRVRRGAHEYCHAARSLRSACSLSRRNKLRTSDVTILVAALVLLLSPVSSLPSPLLKQSSQRRRQKTVDGELPTVWIHSKLVAFAAEKPSYSPWSVAAKAARLRRSTVRALLANATSIGGQVRRRRTVNSDEDEQARQQMKQSVCDSVSDWVPKTEAEDMWGNTVTLSQSINIGGTLVNQYFYETFCRYDVPRPCRGINTNNFASVCENKFIWAYARIETTTGTEEWNLVNIRSSCNCALYPVAQLERPSVWDDLR